MTTWLLSLLISFNVGSGVHFLPLSVDDAMTRAKKEKKHLLIDTYAIWCKPCKQMDEVLKDPVLGDYINDHFISIRVDMDGNQGRLMQDRFGVVWLPTLVLLNSEGQVKNKIDRLVSVPELHTIIEESLGSLYTSERTDLFSDPFQTSSTKEEAAQPNLITEKEAPIIYVYDDRASSGRPHIMYHEAYLHMQLMDGKHGAVVRKYLSTQDDWSSEKNIRFIFDFLEETEGKQFNYFIKNRSRFEDVIGKDKVKRSLQVLVYQKLYNGFPRPDLDEATKLFAYLDPGTANQKAREYFLERSGHEN